jgi:hypothetical protein
VSDPDALADWLLTTRGRLARIFFGTALILVGLGFVGGFLGVLLLIIGAIPIASAAYGALLIGPLLGRDTMGRRPQDQADDDDESQGEDGGEERTADAGDDSSGDEDAPEADPDWSAPPVARAERPEGQEARTRDLRAGE